MFKSQFRQCFRKVVAGAGVRGALWLLLAIIATPAGADMGEGVAGWAWEGRNPPVSFATPTEACYDEWQAYNGLPTDSRFIGAFCGSPSTCDCSWTTVQYLCTAETPGGRCSYVLPSQVDFYCTAGYTRAGNGVCIKDVVNQGPSCSANARGTRNDTAGNPILITSGAKLHEEEDFATTDQRLSVKRYYRSSTQLYNNVRLRSPLGTLNGWAFWFAVEWQLQDSGSSGTLYLPTGEALTFLLDSTGTNFVPADPAIGNTNYSIEYVGTPPSNWSTVTNASSQWRVREKQSGRVWLLQTLVWNPAFSKYNYGRPSQIIDADGYTRSLTYNALGEVQSLTDTLGRSLSFAWRDFVITTANAYIVQYGAYPSPEMVSKITMSDGTSISYTYDPPVSGPPSTATAQHLASVNWLNADGGCDSN